MRQHRILALILVLGFLLGACAPAEEATPTVEESSVEETSVEGVSLLSTAVAAFGTPTGTPAYQQWAVAPEMTIDPDTIYIATLKTEVGDIVVELYADKAPLAVNNFIFLASQGFYDNTTFFRVIPGFMAQAGDPGNSGTGGPGYMFEDEFTPELLFDGPGYLAMANRGANTNGSQFFLTYAETPWLNARHTIFGKLVDGMRVLGALTPRDPEEAPDFEGTMLLTVSIAESEQSLLPTPTATAIPVVPEVEEGRPLANLPIDERENLYTGKPSLVIDPEATYLAHVETPKGTITIALEASQVPDLVNNFVVLADLGYWDGFPLSHIEPEVFVLTGSPAGDPASDIGYTLAVEGDFSNTEGAVGYWFRQDRIAPSGSQFYILMTDLSMLLDAYPTVFGYVIEGMDVVRSLEPQDTITSINIEIAE